MKVPYYTRKDWLIISVLLPPVIAIINYWIFGARYFTDTTILVLSSLISVTIGFFSWMVQIVVAICLQKKYPAVNQTIRRLFCSLLSYILITSATISLVFWLYDITPVFDYSINTTHLVWAIITGMLADILAASFHEVAAFHERWKRAAIEAEQLKMENLQTQLESLKAQVNPHFLFNSLNSLSSLISEDAMKAEKFLDELSKVYRYLLRTNDGDLTTLSEEMQFLYSYYHLLKIRYGESLRIQIDIDEQYRGFQLPPLTIQLLVENAVKHNLMMKSLPLRIYIKTEAGKLVVTNNLQRKVRKVTSNRVGLNNIARKYKLLKQEEIVVTEDNGEFSVFIPLIKESGVF